MGWSVSEHSEPSRKLDLWDKRLGRLRASVKAGEGPHHVAKAAENLRLAALALIKAKHALIREYPRRDPRGRITANLRADEDRWRSLTVEAIVGEYGRTG
jgi:hypothetical protein